MVFSGSSIIMNSIKLLHGNVFSYSWRVYINCHVPMLSFGGSPSRRKHLLLQMTEELSYGHQLYYDLFNVNLKGTSSSSVVKNLKIHYSATSGTLLQIPPLTTYKRYHNFEVFNYWWNIQAASDQSQEDKETSVKQKKISFSYFRSSGTVNVSGIPNFNSLPQVITLCNYLLNESLTLQDLVIDNSTSVGDLKEWFPIILNTSLRHPIHLRRLKNFVDGTVKQSSDLRSDYLSLSLRPHFFPGAVLRLTAFNGCLIVFSTGKFIIVGAKTPCQIQRVEEKLRVLIKKFIECKISPEEMKYAASVAM